MSSKQEDVNGDVTIISNESTSAPTPPFGHQMLKHFLFDKDFVNLNHGSFGASPHPVREVMHHYQKLVECRPDPFLRYDYPKLLDASRCAIADLVHAPPDEIVFVPNATTGVNTVLRSLVFQPGDSILYFNTTYGACAKTVEYVCEISSAKGIRLNLEYPIEDEDLLERFRGAIRKEKEKKAEGESGKSRVRIAIIDTIVSMPGVRMPFEKMVEICRQEGVLSLVDGAHGVGHIDLNLSRLDADFFVSNCHKWLFTPRPSAVFHVPKRNQPLIRSSIPTSHGFVPHPTGASHHQTINPLPKSSKPAFTTLFEFVGTIDPAPYLSLPAALTFRANICGGGGGETAIREYCFDLARRGGQLVADLLGTEVLTPSASGETCFSNVRLPVSMSSGGGGDGGGDGDGDGVEDVPVETRSEVAQEIMRRLADDHNTFVAVVWHGRAWWARLSAQVYLELTDFQWVAGVLGKVCGAVRVRVGEWEMEGGKEAKKRDGDVDLDGVEGMVESVAIN